jgi:tRNA(Ile)-lysidine synthase
MREGWSFELKVRRTVESQSMLREGDHVLVAVSGGADSVALLHCLANIAPELRLRLTVAHLNHTLRGADSAGDESFVAALAGKLGLPCVVRTVDVRASATARRANLEAEARRLRYLFLRETAASAGATKIAVGHTRDDQAETVLFRLLRGTGITGLSGIRPVLAESIVRPLIDCTRGEVIRYLARRGIEWREDHTNADLSYRRNRIRHELIPYLEAHFNPRVREALAREARLARSAADYLEGEGRRWLDRLLTRGPDGLSLRADSLAQADPAVQSVVLRLAFAEASGAGAALDSRHIESLLALCRPGRSGRRRVLPAGCVALREFDQLRFVRQGFAAQGFTYELPVPGSCRVSEAQLEITARREDCPTGVRWSPNSACLESSVLVGSLRVRRREPGDTYGGPGHRKVKKVLIDRKVPSARRDTLPLVVAGDIVVWIPGVPPPRHLRAKPGSRDALLLEARPIG